MKRGRVPVDVEHSKVVRAALTSAQESQSSDIDYGIKLEGFRVYGNEFSSSLGWGGSCAENVMHWPHARWAREYAISIRIICLSMFEDHEMASSAFHSEACAYLSKSGYTDALISTIRGEDRFSSQNKT